MSDISDWFVALWADVFGELSLWLFHQNGAAFYTSREKSLWMRNNRIYTLTWPAKSPDINKTRNVWDVMAPRVYSGFRSYNTIFDVKDVIKDVWKSVAVENVQKLYRSFPRRLLAVIDTRRGDTKYWYRITAVTWE